MAEVQDKGMRWGDKQLRANVYKAVKDDDMQLLVRIIDELAKIANKQREKTVSQQKQAVPSPKSPPALRKDLDAKKMYLLYQELKSFSAVGKQFNCNYKTVKNRLRAAGYKV